MLFKSPSGCLPDYSQYMCYTSWWNDIQYMQVMCPMSREPLSGCPMLDIGYLIESNRQTALDKLYIIQLLLLFESMFIFHWGIALCQRCSYGQYEYAQIQNNIYRDIGLMAIQLLPTRYSINITNNECMYMRWISNQIFI